MKRIRTSLPEPPWAWGAAEVNEWIRSAYPSEGRPKHSVRRGPKTIARLRIVVEGADTERVRATVARALESVGLEIVAGPSERAKHRADLAVRRSAGGDRVTVSVRFQPPIHTATCVRVLGRIGDDARILRVASREHRTVLRARPR